MKRILLVDEYAIVRKGIRVLIAEQIASVCMDEARTEEEAIQLMKEKQYQLIVLDPSMPNTDFCKLLEWIQVKAPDAHILILSMQSEEIYGLRCLQLGVRGFLCKSATNEEIILAIRKVLNGEKYISRRLSELLIERLNNPRASDNPFDRLSQREMEIASQLEKGKSLNEICQILNIQYSTANTYKRRIFEKLRVGNVLDLAKMVNSFDRPRFDGMVYGMGGKASKLPEYC
jgi:two-component system invasion response regulator UvrY